MLAAIYAATHCSGEMKELVLPEDKTDNLHEYENFFALVPLSTLYRLCLLYKPSSN